MRKSWLWLTALAALSGACAHTCTPRVSRENTSALDPSDPAAFATAINAFGLDIWEGLRMAGHSQNLSISPASIATALAMVYGGAGGQTAEELAYALHVQPDVRATMRSAGALVQSWNSSDRSSYTLSVANRLFGAEDYEFRESYILATKQTFGAALQRLDFVNATEASRAQINGWVSEKTHERIPELLPSGAVHPRTRLVLVNALYFHGLWQTAFDAERTKPEAFYASGTDEVEVPMMHGEGGRYASDDGVQLLELGYRGDELAMLFVLPADRAGLPVLEMKLDAALVARWVGQLRVTDDVEVSLPRFRVETRSLGLGPVLDALGVRQAFTDDADFTAMSTPSQIPLKIDEVYHRVFVDLNETGTEAAAATGVAMEALLSGDLKVPLKFKVDHPFLFILRERATGAILFVGRVVNPLT